MLDLLAGPRPHLAPGNTPSGLLRGFIDDVIGGSGRAVWIEGGPGTGKTALLSAALADAGFLGCRLAGSRGHRSGPRLRLNPMLECLGLDPTSRDLRRVLNAGGPAADRLLAMFVELCEGAPLVVAIDDLHLADPASLHFWARLAAETRTRPLLLLATTTAGTWGPYDVPVLRPAATVIRMAG